MDNSVLNQNSIEENDDIFEHIEDKEDDSDVDIDAV
jgi:hypothetical protein